MNFQPAKEMFGEDVPWWVKSKTPLQVSPSAKSINIMKEKLGDDFLNGDVARSVGSNTPQAVLAEDEAVTDDQYEYEEGEEEEEDEEYEEEEYEEEGEGGEGDWEWEYYEEEGEGGPGDVEEEEEEEEAKLVEDIDERAPWIVEGLMDLVPQIPKRAPPGDSDEEDEDGRGIAAADATSMISLTQSNAVGYREWLEESAASLQRDGEVAGVVSGDEDAATPTAEEPGKQEEEPSKAQKLVDKIRGSEGALLKRLLFSLKDMFQSDRNLVYDFVTAGGLEVLVTLGDDDQLQNLILRALGQIMLYVDGMNGVTQNSGAVQFLYKLIAAPNALVCKTAIKLLLVFVEYADSNCLLLVQESVTRIWRSTLAV